MLEIESECIMDKQENVSKLKHLKLSIATLTTSQQKKKAIKLSPR